MTIADLITSAFRELGIAPLSGDLNPALAALGRDVLNRLLDQWNALGDAVYADVFSPFTTTPSLNPHTIGPSGTWTLAQRPVSIEDISIDVSGSGVWTSLGAPHDAAWYAAQASPSLTGIPTDAYYDLTWPNGSLYFVNVPSSAYAVRILARQVLASVALTTTFTMPPGYQAALTDSLKETLAAMPMFHAAGSSDLVAIAARSRDAVFGQRASGVHLRTADDGMPGGCGGWYDYKTGTFR